MHQHLPIATGVLAWNQTKPYSKVTAILKFSSLPIVAITAVAVLGPMPLLWRYADRLLIA